MLGRIQVNQNDCDRCLDAEIVKLDSSDFLSVQKLRNDVVMELREKGLSHLLADIPDEDLELWLSNTHDSMGVRLVNSKDLIAFSVVYYPNLDDDDNLGIGYVPRTDLSRVIHKEVTLVSSAFRGNHLQTMLTQKLLSNAYNEGAVWAFSTTSPMNRYSTENMEKIGLEVVDTVTKYGGLQRHVHKGDLREIIQKW